MAKVGISSAYQDIRLEGQYSKITIEENAIYWFLN